MSSLPRIVAAALLVAAGCAQERILRRPCPSYRSPELARTELRRVIRVPFHDEANAGPARSVVEAAFSSELEKASHLEVVPLGADEDTTSARESPRRTGRYRLDTVLDLAVRYGADAVLFGSITSYRPYVPQALGVRVELVSASSGLVVWSVDARFDLADEESVQTLREAYDRRSADDPASPDWETVRTSPTRMAALVSSLAAQTLVRP